MAEPTKAPEAAAKPAQAPKPQNPAMRMMGMPNIRFKLPSRNWMIFLTITGSFFGAVIYDRTEKKKIQRKYANLVAHIAKEPLPSNEMRRKLTVFLSAQPGDGLRSSREYFKEYVKPILVAGALDYEVIEGRREGEVRAALAEKIRQRRRELGEGPQDINEKTEAEILLAGMRKNYGIHEEPIAKGDLVLGRNTWREYIRGLHEGWLGPLEQPFVEQPEVELVLEEPSATTPDDASPANTAGQPTDKEAGEATEKAPEEAANKEKTEKEKRKEEEDKKPKGPKRTYLLPQEYSSRQLPPSLPEALEPSCPVHFPHLLGFLNTPIRIYRFLNKRHVAESVGEEVAALVLAAQTRPFRDDVVITDPEAAASGEDGSPASSEQSAQSQEPMKHWEQEVVLSAEEKDWHKAARRPKPEAFEREWLDEVVIDPRIGSRMSKFVIPPEEAARAERIMLDQEYIKGEVRPEHVPFWKQVWDYTGIGKLPDHPCRKVVVGNYEGEFDDE
ncbi:mitochondrial import inner membrane translocase subunit tim54 [Ascosphaera atra]|nr:mitochondrial import inner membrane translocase subunit tim54 [Ascosphaera atra]